jgi:hypothetical protein
VALSRAGTTLQSLAPSSSFASRARRRQDSVPNADDAQEGLSPMLHTDWRRLVDSLAQGTTESGLQASNGGWVSAIRLCVGKHNISSVVCRSCSYEQTPPPPFGVVRLRAGARQGPEPGARRGEEIQLRRPAREAPIGTRVAHRCHRRRISRTRRRRARKRVNGRLRSWLDEEQKIQ